MLLISLDPLINNFSETLKKKSMKYFSYIYCNLETFELYILFYIKSMFMFYNPMWIISLMLFIQVDKSLTKYIKKII